MQGSRCEVSLERRRDVGPNARYRVRNWAGSRDAPNAGVKPGAGGVVGGNLRQRVDAARGSFLKMQIPKMQKGIRAASERLSSSIRGAMARRKRSHGFCGHLTIVLALSGRISEGRPKAAFVLRTAISIGLTDIEVGLRVVSGPPQ